ncbi:F-box protein At1g47340-like [Capsella rubella]|uniref:F-box protein At1g47340-like n=1 Tax=Capsella rubella TaxID=81985 RepID=UPI000CD49EB7|nr:F-box protein At1g47340-like [Capsella rubella]
MVSDSIPTDLILDILLRLPAKSIARFHCVSKLWETMLPSSYFTDLFMTRSLPQPRLFFAIGKPGLLSIFSLPQQHQSPYEKSSSVTAEFHMKFPQENMQKFSGDLHYSCGYAAGLLYFYGMWTKVPMVLNPKTGRYVALTYPSKYLALPRLSSYRRTYSFIGFDPTDKIYKVLFMPYPFCYDQHTVLTLGTGEMSWRRINCALRHETMSEGICINGVLYYLGNTSQESVYYVIVCFDVRSEKFKYIDTESYCQLINYMGKLGLVYYNAYAHDAVELRVWVLEDAEKQQWSKYAYTLSDDKFLVHHVFVVAVTATGEIVLCSDFYTSKKPFYVFYFNPEKNTLQRVEIQVFGEYHEAIDNPSRVHDDVFVNDRSRLYAFADHVKDLNVNDSKLLKSKRYEAV